MHLSQFSGSKLNQDWNKKQMQLLLLFLLKVPQHNRDPVRWGCGRFPPSDMSQVCLPLTH